MGNPQIESALNFARAKLIMKAVDDRLASQKLILLHDLDKILDIRKYMDKEGNITHRQYRTLTHFSKVYKLTIPNSLDFLLGE